MQAVRRTGRLFATVASQLEHTATSLPIACRSALWSGPDATRFLDVMATRHEPQLRRVAEELRGLGQQLQRQASQQESASQADGGAAVPTSAGTLGPSVPTDPPSTPSMPPPVDMNPDDLDDDGVVEDFERQKLAVRDMMEAAAFHVPIELLHLDDGWTPQGQGYDESRDQMLTTYYQDDAVLLSIQDRRTGVEVRDVMLGGFDGGASTTTSTRRRRVAASPLTMTSCTSQTAARSTCTNAARSPRQVRVRRSTR